jgi:hypothetical protein
MFVSVPDSIPARWGDRHAAAEVVVKGQLQDLELHAFRG